MSYVTRVLQPGETVLSTTSLHWLIYSRALGMVILAAILAVGSLYSGPDSAVPLMWGAGVFALLGVVFWLSAIIRRSSTELAVTDRRVIYKAGILSRHTLEMNRSKVESIDVDQSILGRIFGFGTVTVRGTGGSLEPIRNISDPLTFRSHITAG
jgi:uncharacterized membrane protein YdbT with pleckstrin-like domain